MAMAEKGKDKKKLRLILKLPSKPSHSGAVSVLQNVQTSMPQEVAAETAAAAAAAASASSNRVATPPKKRKFKTLVEGDARDAGHGGVDGVISRHGAAVAAVSTPPVFKAPLPPLAKKPSHKKKEKPLNGEVGASTSGSGHGHGTTGSPAKKVLEGVLDKLKKKDTYGVFSEPVDARMVPDYYDVIKEPMDFGTMYKKISKGVYHTLSLFEKDIMLICNNAMRYNGSDTIYYKQARSIQDAARKALDLVAAQAGATEIVKPTSHKKQPHTAKKGWKNTAAVKSLLEPANSDYASGATLAGEGDDVAQSNRYDVGSFKKGAPSDRSGSVAGDEAGWGMQSHGSVGLELDPDLQDEHGATLKPATLKDGRRPLSTEEYHRSSYKPRNLPAHGRGSPLAGIGGELHHLVPTGYQSEMAYVKSLSQFASKLGPEGWKFAARRMQKVLSPCVPFGQGWVGEHEAPLGTIFKSSPSTLTAVSTTDTKVPNPTMNDRKFVATTLSGLPAVSATSHTPAASSPFVDAPKSSRASMISSVGQTSMDSLRTTETSAMLASGALSQALLLGNPVLQDSKPERAPQPAYQHEQNRGPGMPSASNGLGPSTLWSSQAPPSQAPTFTSGTTTLQNSSETPNGVSSRWTGSTSQAAPTFVYSTAVQTLPSATGMNVGQDEVSQAHAYSLGLLQADANARAVMQSYGHLSQTTRPAQYVPQQMYTNIPSYGLQPGSLIRLPYGSNQFFPSSQPLQSSKQELGNPKPAASQPLQLQVDSLGSYGLSQTQNATQMRSHSSRPPPDLNLQPLDSPSTPKASGQLNALGASQPSLSLQL